MNKTVELEPTAELYAELPARYPELAGKVAIVTGSTKGIGREIAIRLAKEGMKVVINSRTPEDVEATTSQFRAVGADVIGVPADQSTTEDVDKLFEATLDAFGAVHLLVNNAASVLALGFFEADEEELDRELASNIRGPYLYAYRVAEHMRDLGHGGNIINISSVGGLRAHWQGLPYDMTKGAIDAMTRAMALELAKYDIRVNAIAPGAILTEERPPLEDPEMQAVIERIPLKRFGRGYEIGAAVAFLASSDAAYITGQVIYVDAGITAQLSPPGQPI